MSHHILAEEWRPRLEKRRVGGKWGVRLEKWIFCPRTAKEQKESKNNMMKKTSVHRDWPVAVRPCGAPSLFTTVFSYNFWKLRRKALRASLCKTTGCSALQSVSAKLLKVKDGERWWVVTCCVPRDGQSLETDLLEQEQNKMLCMGLASNKIGRKRLRKIRQKD